MKTLRKDAKWFLGLNLGATLVNINIAHGATLYWVQFGISVLTAAAGFIAKGSEVDAPKESP